MEYDTKPNAFINVTIYNNQTYKLVNKKEICLQTMHFLKPCWLALKLLFNF